MGAFNNHVDKKGWVGGQPNVHVRWVGGSSNVHVDILSIIQIKLKMSNFLLEKPSCFTSIKITIFFSPTSFPPVKLGTVLTYY